MIVKFREAAQFLQFLMLRPPVPNEVLRFSDGWGMQVVDRDSEVSIAILQRQFGWEMAWVECGGTSVPIFQILSGIWEYRDPLNGPPAASPIRAGTYPGGVYYDISDEDNNYEYLLGARDEAESQKILNSLQRNLVRGVSGTPLLLAPTEAPSPFVFFFLVRWKQPDPFVFERAGRVWWGANRSESSQGLPRVAALGVDSSRRVGRDPVAAGWHAHSPQPGLSCVPHP
jgi:hypothetical protein